MKANNDDIIKELNIEVKKLRVGIYKHLNRIHKCIWNIPIWRDNKYVIEKYILIQELPKGQLFSKEYMVKHGINIDTIDDNYKYSIVYQIIDKNLNMVITKGFCNRHDIVNIVIKLLLDAIDLKRLTEGKA